ncbi:MAG: excinuclease ABC subunit UvrC [Lachnospiraceae bacterium]|nr:excinuclease ABC subunit UvrC [Lachnospiraceae bacterium]
MLFNIEEELKKLPASPGVYIMHDDKDNIIYVGKAISLKNRVRQYFQSGKNHSMKIKKMVTHIAYFEYIVTDSEMEALILECNLIKEHEPKYNTMLKDGKSYPYIKVTVNEDFPRVMFARQMKRDKSKYFGPFTNVTAVKDTLELIKKIYNIRTCNKSLPKDIGEGRECLNYHIKQCMAPCMGYISKEEYAVIVKDVIAFLNGNYGGVIAMLDNKMREAASKLEFEEAAKYRDYKESVMHIVEKQKINNNTDTDDKDVIACAIDENDAVIQVFFIRGGRIIGREHFHMSEVRDVKEEEILENFIKQYYSGTPYLPKTIITKKEIKDKELIEKWLTAKKGHKVSILIPKKGEKEKLIELAEENAKIVLRQDREKILREERKTKGALKELEELTGIGNINRIESYDISNISGYLSVASMVVFEGGKPKKNDYRKFRIKSVVGPDDYGSMKEVLERRFKHGLEDINIEEFSSFSRFPDVILMDGGKGQVNVALEVLNELNLNIPVCGMVKDDNHRTRGILYNNEEIEVKKSSEAFKLVTRIQDETHRFAIEYHRSLRSREQVHSVLDDISGIGKVRRKALMKHFKTIDAIKEASIDELMNVESMDKKSAKQVFDFFNKNV